MKKKRATLYALALSTILFVSLASSAIVAEAATGNVRSRRNAVMDVSQTTSDTTNTLIDVETAKTTALNHAGLTADQVTFIQQKLGWEDGRQVYEIEFYTDHYSEYDYEIDACTGAIVGFDYDAEHDIPSTTAASDGSYISEAKAMEIALSNVSGATTANVTKCKLDRDDGRLEYEIEIRYNYREYDFEIDACTGTILDWEID